jgi:hypothetical protein
VSHELLVYLLSFVYQLRNHIAKPRQCRVAIILRIFLDQLIQLALEVSIASVVAMRVFTMSETSTKTLHDLDSVVIRDRA